MSISCLYWFLSYYAHIIFIISLGKTAFRLQYLLLLPFNAASSALLRPPKWVKYKGFWAVWEWLNWFATATIKMHLSSRAKPSYFHHIKRLVMSSQITNPSSYFISLWHQREWNWPTYHVACKFHSFNTKLTKVYNLFKEISSFLCSTAPQWSISVLNYLTCTPGSKALMFPMRPCVLCKLRCFNEGCMNNSGTMFHSRHTTGTHSKKKKKNYFRKIGTDVKSVFLFSLIYRTAHHLLINKHQ